MNRTANYNLQERNENLFSLVESSDHRHDGSMVVGIMGCGAVAKIVTDFQAEGKLSVDLKFFQDIDQSKAQNLAARAGGLVVTDVDVMLDEVDLVIEDASRKVAVDIIPQILRKGKDIVITSIDALLDLEFRDSVESMALENNCRIYAPSGDVVGLDGVKAASMGEITGVTLLIRNSPESLQISADEEVILYEGKAHDAVDRFPINLNVAAALSVITDGEVDLKIIADPMVDYSRAEIHVVGDFGELKTTTWNINWAADPKTSVLAAYSVIKLLENLNGRMRVGL